MLFCTSLPVMSTGLTVMADVMTTAAPTNLARGWPLTYCIHMSLAFCNLTACVTVCQLKKVPTADNIVDFHGYVFMKFNFTST